MFSTSSSSTINSELRVTRNWYAPLTCLPGNISATNAESTEDRKTKSCSPPGTFFGSWMIRGSERRARTSDRWQLRPHGSSPLSTTRGLRDLYRIFGKGGAGSRQNTRRGRQELV